MNQRANYGQGGDDYGAQSRNPPQTAPKKEAQVTQSTKERVEAAKAFLESELFHIKNKAIEIY